MTLLFSSSNHQVSQLVVDADFDPQLPARVLGRFAQLNELPERFQVERRSDADLRLTLEFESAEPEDARRLAARLLNMPSVRTVDLSFVRRRQRRAA